MGAVSRFSFHLQLVVEVGTVEEFLDHLRHGVHGRTWPAVTGFASPSPNTPKLKKPPEGDLLKLLEAIPRVAKQPADVDIGFGKLSGIHWGQRPDRRTFYLRIGLYPDENLFDAPAECVRALTHVTRRMLERTTKISGAVERQGDAETCIPFVPLAKTRRPLVITTVDEVYDAYLIPEDFWSAGWTVEQFADKRLLTRCQDVVTKGEVLAEIQDHQWQMARAAKPKRTAYGHPDVTDDEREIYEHGDAEPRTQAVHIRDGIAEYTCYLDPGEHLYGFEIYVLRWMVENKQAQDGTPVKGVRVVFVEEWQAQSEKRPLLDNGIEVWVQDVERGDRQITE